MLSNELCGSVVESGDGDHAPIAFEVELVAGAQPGQAVGAGEEVEASSRHGLGCRRGLNHLEDDPVAQVRLDHVPGRRPEAAAEEGGDDCDAPAGPRIFLIRLTATICLPPRWMAT